MKTVIILFALLGSFVVNAQPANTVPKNIRATNTLDNLFDANGLAISDNLYGIPLEPGGVEGNAYLNPEWRRTTLMLYDAEKIIEGFPVRYEIDQDQFEIKSSQGVRVLDGKKVKSFVWLDSATQTPHYFVNGRDLRNAEKVRLFGFYEVLVDGELTLLSKTEAVIKEPTYNEKFDVGKRETQILKKTNFYYLDRNLLQEVPPNRKKFFPLFGQHAAEMERYAKTNKLSTSNAGHLTAIFLRYNSILATN